MIIGRGRHEIVIRWQLAVGSMVRLTGDTAQVTSQAGAFCVLLTATGPVLLTVETRPVAVGFGSTADAPVLTCWVEGILPVHATTVWSRAADCADTERTT
jgi:hypothetical protein